ncbi:methyltransferase domain-containing protein [Streptomyces sp. NBRC 110028]|uniref:methyltransferase domain-containing protein n=1 Tax=Streptomyces sp. NBRC 110028 TaxID=1621260 RepID=UPI0006E3C762|nr:methyltransferase domain-containing protein [Streptomyces sp. NBRC 110028]
MTDGWQERHTALLNALAASGALSPDWRGAFEVVPRHRFIPADIWEQKATCVPVTTDDAWWDLVYRDVPIVTQVDDGRGDGPGLATSSNSMPTMVARMLGALDVAAGHRVLEIGTGSGWNAALLAERLGSENVTTVEVDEALAKRAAKVIEAAGYRPDVVWGDGVHGWESAAPYTRIIATCAVRRIPHAWVRQTTVGGIIVAPLAGDFWSGALVRLETAADGTARGRFVGGARFMPMRSERPRPDAPVDSGTGRRVSPGPQPLGALADLGFALYAGARLPGVVMADGTQDDTYQVWLHDREGSAAVVNAQEAWQYGPRDLWREVTAVYDDFVTAGCPSADVFELTVTSEGQQMWPHPGSQGR